MKRVSHEFSRKTGRMTVLAAFRNVFRQPTRVSIQVAKLDSTDVAKQPLMDGDVKEVYGALSGIAEIAWDMGWRPAGLDAAVARTFQTHKIMSPEA